MTEPTISRRDVFRSAVAGGVGMSLLSAGGGSRVFAAAPRKSTEAKHDDDRLPNLCPQPAVEGVSWKGTKAQASGEWKILKGPDGLAVDSRTGQLAWENPCKGLHFVALRIRTESATEDVESWIHVVPNACPGPQPGTTLYTLVSTAHVDFLLPPRIAELVKQQGTEKYVDAGWMYLRELTGRKPPYGSGRQIVCFDATMAGGLSGNPVRLGHAMWGLNKAGEPAPATAWMLGAFWHEAAHLHMPGGIVAILDNNKVLDAFFHHCVDCIRIPLFLRSLQYPQIFGIGAHRDEFQRIIATQKQDVWNGSKEYREWRKQGGRAATFNPDSGWRKVAVATTMCFELAESFGPQSLEKIIRALRPDGLGQETYSQIGDVPVRRNTLLCCLMSCAAGQNVCEWFDKKWGFDIDYGVYQAIEPGVKKVMAVLPDEDLSEWKHCPVNDRYYRLTPLRTSWHEAERLARACGGHLAPVRNEEELKWFVTRYTGHGYGPIWIGRTDEKKKGEWLTSTGEKESFIVWAPGKPGAGASDNFMVMHLGLAADARGKFCDRSEIEQFYGLIEVESTPSTAKRFLPADLDKTRPRQPRQSGSSRTWTSADGGHRTEATFLGLEDDTVRLKKADGTEITVPLDKLSPLDQQYIKRRAAGH